MSNITRVNLNRIENGGRMKAVASVTIDDELVIHDLKVIEGTERLFVAMPSRKMPDGSYKDIVHPINQAMRGAIESAVIEKYKEAPGVSLDESSEEITGEGSEEGLGESFANQLS